MMYCLLASSWLLSVGFRDRFCWKCVCSFAADSPLPLLYLGLLGRCHWTKCYSVQYPPQVNVSAPVSQSDELPKRQRYTHSQAAWWIGRHKTLIKNCVVKTAMWFFPPLSSLRGVWEECRNMYWFTGIYVTRSGDNVYTSVNSGGS